MHGGFDDMPACTKEFLSNLRDEEIDTLSDGIRPVNAIRTVGIYEVGDRRADRHPCWFRHGRGVDREDRRLDARRLTTTNPV